MDGEDEHGRSLLDDLGPLCHVAPLVSRRGGAVEARLAPPREHRLEARSLELLLQDAHDGEVEIALPDARERTRDTRVDAAVARIEHDDGTARPRCRAAERKEAGAEGKQHQKDDPKRGERHTMTVEEPHTAIV